MKIVQINKPAIEEFRTTFCGNYCYIPPEVESITVAYYMGTPHDYEMTDEEDKVVKPANADRVASNEYADLHRLFNIAYDCKQSAGIAHTYIVNSL